MRSNEDPVAVDMVRLAEALAKADEAARRRAIVLSKLFTWGIYEHENNNINVMTGISRAYLFRFS
jgi:hypothetical protein